MLNGKFLVALIPARKGSKGLPGKNRLEIHGQSLTLRSLLLAKESEKVDLVFLSSDDDVLLEAAATAGFQTSRRPDRLASDSTTASEVIYYEINRIKDLLKVEDFYILYLQPTSPLRTVNHVEQAMSAIESSKAKSVISARKAVDSAYKQFQVIDHKLKSCISDLGQLGNRQNIPSTFVANGSIYLFSAQDFISLGNFIPFEDAFVLEMSDQQSIDIDTLSDFELVVNILEE